MKWGSWVLSFVANKSTVGLKFKLFIIFSKYFRFIIHSLLVSFFLDSISASSLNTCGTWVTGIQLSCFKIKFHIRYTTWSISIDLVLSILFIAATADVLSIWIKMWILWKLLHKAFNPNNAALSSKIFMCRWDSSDEKFPPSYFLPLMQPTLLKMHQYLTL